jgi:CheY-like chemotaxis protein
MSTTRTIEGLKKELEQRTRELELANCVQSRLRAASHDLRQPLHALGLFVAQARDHVSVAAETRIIEQIDAAVAAVNERLNALLDIAQSYPGSEPKKHDKAPMPARGSLDIASGKLVLVIDDDLSILEGTCGLLRGWGCNVISADSLVALTNLIERHRHPDLIISDLHLSNGESGIEAIAALRKASRNAIPAFLVSGDTSLKAKRTAQSNGYPLLPKPLDPMSLRTTINRILKKKEAPETQ